MPRARSSAARIEADHGRVIDMAGDSVLAVFETAAGAVTAAIAVQQRARRSIGGVPQDRRMRFRIGIHMGDVIEKADGTVYGDGVNIASRLQALAEPGGIIVSDAVHGAVRGRIVAELRRPGRAADEEHRAPGPCLPAEACRAGARRPRARALRHCACRTGLRWPCCPSPT